MKKVNDSIIKQLRRYTEENYAKYHIKAPCFKNGNKKTVELIDKIMRFVRLLPEELGAIEKAVLMYQIITSTVTYDRNEANEDRYSYLEALKNKTAVCMGIAELYCALCTACGVKSKIVIGYSTDSTKDDAYHAWVQVYLPNKNNQYSWYMADPTWDLVEFRNEWKYFMKSDTFFLNNGHYWLKTDYERCEKNLTSVKPYPSNNVNRVIEIFRQMVCNE